ncbi:hypothetical protein [Catenulispora rubra]|uniref:hypothetical protein n=1 Tax=Catenulispora rubra TaxID=280293 RepID=UPI0018924058|nr:hypothetical protein [Catenulispora rubra]
MSRVVNPTRPAATTAEVRQRLKNLGGAKRERLEDWGYPIAKLDEWAARGDAQADEVDALLAIILNRADYTHDDADVAAAEKIGKKLGALMTPHAYLVSQHKAEEKRAYNIRPGAIPGETEVSGKSLWLILGGVFVLIVVGGVIVAAVR